VILVNMAEFEDTPEVSDEEKLQIAQHYLLSSPPGQFHEVLADVKKLVTSELLTDSLISGIARVSNLKNSKVVTAPSGAKVLLTPVAEIDPTHYFDPVDRSVFLVNHLTLVTTADAVESNQDETHEALRVALQRVMGNYVSVYYQTEASAGGVYGRDGKLHIAVSGEKNNLKNFWSGKWSSLWTLTPSGGGRALSISGDIKLHVHYFEDGNLQLQSSKAVPAAEVSGKSNEELAEQVLKFIQAQESALQSGLEDMYSNMNNETFRSMRRIMPITRTKMEWNVNAVRMVRQVQKK